MPRLIEVRNYRCLEKAVGLSLTSGFIRVAKTFPGNQRRLKCSLTDLPITNFCSRMYFTMSYNLELASVP